MVVEPKRIQIKKLVKHIILIPLCILPLIYIDTFGFTFLISAFCLTFYMQSAEGQRSGSDKAARKAVWSALAFLCIALYVSIVYLLKVQNNPFFNQGITIHGFRFLPSYFLLIYYAIPVIYLKSVEKVRLGEVFKLDKQTLLITILVCLPIAVFNIREFASSNGLGFLKEIKSKELGMLDAAFMSFQGFIIAALLEELYFRGLIYNLLKRIFNKILPAQVAASLLFTAVHLSLFNTLLTKGFSGTLISNLVEIFILGIVTARIYEKSKSLLPGIMLHGLIDGGFQYILKAALILFCR